MSILYIGYDKKWTCEQEYHLGWTWACLERDIPIFILED